MIDSGCTIFAIGVETLMMTDKKMDDRCGGCSSGLVAEGCFEGKEGRICMWCEARVASFAGKVKSEDKSSIAIGRHSFTSIHVFQIGKAHI